MALVYSYKINAARVGSQDSLTNVVKGVEVTVTGTDGAAEFDLPVVVKLADADADSFTLFALLTEDQIVGWVENDPSLDGTKAHIALVVEKEKAKLALENKPLPWAPAPEGAPVPPANAA